MNNLWGSAGRPQTGLFANSTIFAQNMNTSSDGASNAANADAMDAQPSSAQGSTAIFSGNHPLSPPTARGGAA